MGRQGIPYPQAPRRTALHNAMYPNGWGRFGAPGVPSTTGEDEISVQLQIEDVRERLGLSYEAIAKAEQHLTSGMHYSPAHHRA